MAPAYSWVPEAPLSLSCQDNPFMPSVTSSLSNSKHPSHHCLLFFLPHQLFPVSGPFSAVLTHALVSLKAASFEAILAFIYAFLSLFPFLTEFLERVNTPATFHPFCLILMKIQPIQCLLPPQQLQSRAPVTSTLLNPMVNPQASNFLTYQQHLPKMTNCPPLS